MKCWAQNVSPCCKVQSREHYISKGLFSDKILYVDNAPFLGGVSKEISKASLTRNCLCKRHNERLSIYDDEAIHFGNALKYCLNLSLRRRKSKAKKFSLHRKTIDYDRFGRWFLKTYLGLSEFFRYDSLVDKDFLANLVYSDGAIGGYVKLSIDMDVRESFQIREVVSIAPLELHEMTVGMQMEIYGIRINAVFSCVPNPAEKLKIVFSENKQGKSCVINFI